MQAQITLAWGAGLLVGWLILIWLLGWKLHIKIVKPGDLLAALFICALLSWPFGYAITFLSGSLQWENLLVRQWLATNTSLAQGIGFITSLLILFLRWLPRPEVKKQEQDQPAW